ncbi:hypothetical protein FB004_103451 [Sinorhizobium medicae]|uniref:hypothetical protein n=1 Tax=Sinorhizobium medicae TaxID=110321 RepID=UPI0011A51611|nr:hypothetical protein [Sinorhizobium medicae]TWA26345.1 hypothetical protein FB004_103451 [Sinorhizobium medicae]
MRYISRDSGPLCYARRATLWTIAAGGKHRKRARLISGILLIAAAPLTSFFDPVPAGYLLVVAALACVDWTKVQKVALSPTSLIIEQFEQKVQDAEQILEEIHKVEERILFVLTEQMITRGAQKRPGGGFGEDAEFAIYGALQELNKAIDSERLKANMDELRLDMGFQLCNGIFGKIWLEESAANAWANSTRFQVLPDRQKINELASLDGVE